MRVHNDIRSLSGTEKAAVLLLALGDQHAGSLFNMLDDEEIREITEAMSQLGTVNANVVEQLLTDFTSHFSSSASIMGTHDSTERLLLKVMDPARVASIMDQIRGPAGRSMWERLANVGEQVLGKFLRSEHPQTAAVILSRLAPTQAAKVLGILPEAFAIEIVQRMLRIEPLQRDVLADVERTLREEFMNNLSLTQGGDLYGAMAEIFNNFDRTTEVRFMGLLEDRSQDAADRIRALMFTFEDLRRVDTLGIQTVLRYATKERVGLALKGATDEMKELFFSNMSERAGKILQEEMDNMGPVRLREVDEAQVEIVNLTKDLAARGEIIIGSEDEEDQLVY